MAGAEGNGSNRASSDAARAGRRARIDAVFEAVRLSYFAWLPTVASIGLGVGFLVSGEPVWFVLSTVVGLCAFLGWAIWYNIDR